MEKNNVVVTGAGGYIGKFVVSALLDFGANVTAVDLFTDNIDKRARILEYDIFNGKEDIYEDLGCPDVCLHLAWKDGFIHNSQAHIENLYDHYLFSENLIKGGLKHFVAMGSMHEVGYFEGMIQENSPTNPKSMYGIAKNAYRQMLMALNEDNDFVFQWIRGYYILGDDLNNNSIFTKILFAERENKKSFPLNLGKNKNDFIPIKLLAKEIALVVLQENIQGIIDCCSGEATSLKDMVEKFILDFQLKIRPEYGVFPERSYDSPIVYGDTKKIRSIIAQAKENEELNSKIKDLLEFYNIK